MSNIYQSQSDGQYYCRDCKKELEDCTCPSTEQQEACKEFWAEHKEKEDGEG
ncbi:hypothetical protein LCGC14_0788630 [marine sediment metagenome]|uniref:Uncharacterized protein n=1 Tax=marine sediment metagenome TaxID=412755 RepID=A0A0F9QD16_9ZZZZ